VSVRVRPCPSFENWCFHELSAYNLYSESFAELSYWHPASGLDVDFIVTDLAVVIECRIAFRARFNENISWIYPLTQT
jgi:hypothetical protein